VKKEGEWHPGGPWPVLVARDKDLYLIGGTETLSAYRLSFSALSRLIEHGGVRCAFCTCLGFPFWPDGVFEGGALKNSSPPSL